MCMYVVEKKLCLEFTSLKGVANVSAVRMNKHEPVYYGFDIVVFFRLGLNAYFQC